MTQAIAIQDDRPAQVVASESSAIISMIERAARDPSVDVDKFERLMAMSERVQAEAAKKAFNAAMAAAQAELPQVIRKAENVQTKSMYATLESIGAAIDPVITKHGFSLSFGTADCPLKDHYRITCKTSNCGHEQFDFADIPVDIAGIAGTKNKTPTHAYKSTLTYGRSILTQLIFNVKTTKFMPDDDGNAAGGKPVDETPVTEDQANAIRKALEFADADEGKFLAYIKVGAVEDILAAKFDAVMALIQQRKAKAEKKGAK